MNDQRVNINISSGLRRENKTKIHKIGQKMIHFWLILRLLRDIFVKLFEIINNTEKPVVSDKKETRPKVECQSLVKFRIYRVNINLKKKHTKKRRNKQFVYVIHSDVNVETFLYTASLWTGDFHSQKMR